MKFSIATLFWITTTVCLILAGVPVVIAIARQPWPIGCRNPERDAQLIGWVLWPLFMSLLMTNIWLRWAIRRHERRAKTCPSSALPDAAAR